MAPLTTTFEQGATSQPMVMTYVQPERRQTAGDAGRTLEQAGLNGDFVAGMFSEMLAHEQCGARLYRSVAGRTHNPVLKKRYEKFGAETTEHIQILHDLIEAVGGNPAFVSPAGRATEKAGTALLESTFMLGGSLDPMTAEAAMLDAVLLAESKDHANWSSLASLTDSLPDGEIRTAFSKAVSRVEPEEDEHLDWARDMRAKMVGLQAKSSAAETVGMKMETAVAKIQGWFS